jgi:folate-binding protein YgfZ
MTEKSQLDAILHGAAFAPITDRAFLRITGPDATRWLNGMVTNNIKDLSPGQGNYNFLLNNQGRIMGDCTIYREYREPEAGDPRYLLQTDASQLETIQQLLDRFIIMDDVELSRTLEIWSQPVQAELLNGLIVIGEKAARVFSDVMSEACEFLLVDAPEPGSLNWATHAGETPALAPGFILAPPNTRYMYEIWSSRLDSGGIGDELRKQGAVEVSAETLEAYRILSATPRYGTDIRNTETVKDLPQETAQTHALHFSKGCYLGQEIVERIHSRGHVHRTFTQFTLTGSLPTLPAILEANGKSVGELTSATNINDTIYALGYARREVLDTNQPLTYPGGTATNLQLASHN